MAKDEKYKAVISGQEKGVLPGLVRGALTGLSALYRAGMGGRNFLYSKGVLNRVGLPVPVVSVGNITVGGTGKTPLVEYIARHFVERGKKPVILSRGYGGWGGRNDEALVLEENLPGVAHVQAQNRVLAGLRAVREHKADCIVLDDGFQYRRLKRDLDIVVIDARNPFGYGRLLPRGLLREPVEALARADVVVISKIDESQNSTLFEVRDTLEKYVKGGRIFSARHCPITSYVMAGKGKREEGLSTLKGKKVLAFCGIGSPESFRRSVEGVGCEVAGFRSFPDHYSYGKEAIGGLREAAERCGVEALITTQKDAVKLADADFGRELWVLKIAFEFVEKREEFDALLDSI
jgi:tetraacyldisaccharide 4'-kinase